MLNRKNGRKRAFKKERITLVIIIGAISKKNDKVRIIHNYFLLILF
jgi:hypothetical protein